jgi:Lsr2
MAQKVQVILVDDLDGGPAEETVSFSLDGVAYEIDLSEANAAKLRDDFAPYVGNARKVGGRAAATRTTRSRGRRGGRDSRTSDIREWAKANGHQVSDRGRIPASVVDAYEKANA